MDIKAYTAILWGNKWVILATLAVTLAVVTVSTQLSTPVYAASTTLRVASASGTTGSYSDYVYTDRLMNTYVKIAASGPVLDELAKQLGLSAAPEIEVETLPNTELIQISVESPDPKLAMDAANTLAEILIAQGREFYSGAGKSTLEILGEQLEQAESELNQARQEYELLVLDFPDDVERISTAGQTVELRERTYTTLLDQYEQARLRDAIRANTISVVEPAVLPLTAAKPRRVLNIALGFLVGLAGGIGLAFLFENIDARLYTSDRIVAATELTPLGKIPHASPKALSTLAYRSPENGHLTNGCPIKKSAPIQEAFRRLRTNILIHSLEVTNGEGLKTFLITSAEPNEGKSTVAANLALVLAQAGHKVIVVDGDMRMPGLHKILGLPNGTGLSSVLKLQLPWVEAVQEMGCHGLQVLTSGPMPRNPAELLGSPEMKALMEDLSQVYDLVLLDGPALLAVTDAALLAAMVDGVVLVARRNYTREGSVRDACKQLAHLKARMIGVVVNDAEASGSYYYNQRR